MRQEILTVEEIFGCDLAIEGFELLFVEAHAATLGEFAHFAFGSEALGGFGQQVDGLRAHHLVAVHLKLLYAVEDREQGFFVELEEAFFRGFSEENVGGFHRHFVVRFAVYEHGHFATEAFLQHAATGILTMLFDEGIDLFFGQAGEDF